MIHGDKDNVLPFDISGETGNKLGKVMVYGGHGHMIPVEDTSKYSNDLYQFFEDN